VAQGRVLEQIATLGAKKEANKPLGTCRVRASRKNRNRVVGLGRDFDGSWMARFCIRGLSRWKIDIDRPCRRPTNVSPEAPAPGYRAFQDLLKGRLLCERFCALQELERQCAFGV
jgi:hypothetical protein